MPDEATVLGKATVIMDSILLVGWLSFAGLSKVLAKTVYLPYAMLSGLALLEMTTYVVLIAYAANSSSSRRLLASTTLSWAGSICLAVSLALNYLLNLLHVFVYVRYLSTDAEFPKNKTKPREQSLNILVLVVATLTNFRLYQIVFSSLCNARLFKTRLQFVTKLLPVNLLNCLMIVVSVLALCGFGLVVSESVASETKYYAAIMGIVVTALALIFTLAAFAKD